MAHTLSSDVPLLCNSSKTISIIDEEDFRRMTSLAVELRRARPDVFSESSLKERGFQMVLRSGRKLGSCSTSRGVGLDRKSSMKRKRVDCKLESCKRNCAGKYRKFANQSSFCGFNLLPKDLLFYIFSFLTDFSDIARVRVTCRAFREVYSSNFSFPKLDFASCRHIDGSSLLSYLDSSFLPFRAKFKQVILSKCHRLSSQSIQRLFDRISQDAVEHLDIRWCTEFDDAVLDQVSKMLNLNTLLMSHVRRFSSFRLANVFESLRSLRVLDLSFTNCTRTVLFQLHCKYLSVLTLQGVSEVDDEVIDVLSRRLHRLEKLDLSWCPNIGSRSLFSIASNCNLLQEIGLSETKVSDEGLCELVRLCPRVHSIQASRCSRLRDSFVQFIVDNTCLSQRLTFLDISSCHNISDAAVEQLLRRCKNLRYVDVSKLPCRKISCSSI